MTRQRRTLGTVLLAAGLLAGCGAGDSADEPGSPGTGDSTTSSATTSPDSTTATPQGSATAGTGTPTSGASDAVADAVAALQTAAGAVPNGQPFDLERETKQGTQVWEVKVASNGAQFKVDVSADGSKVLAQQQDQTPDDDIQKLQSARIDAVQALQLASGQQDGTLSEMEIDSTDDGTVIWQVDLRQSDGAAVEVNLDASSGDIVNQTSGD